MIVSGDELGCIETWNSLNDLKENSGTFYMGHTSRIVDCCLSSNMKLLYSLSYKDNALFEWKIEEITGMTT